MAGIIKKLKPVSRSISGNDFLEFDPDISIALEYTGSPVNHSLLPKILPLDVDRIPTAKVAVSTALFNNLSLPVVEPVISKNFRVSNDVKLGSWIENFKNAKTHLERSFSDASDQSFTDHVDEIGSLKASDEIGELKIFDENLNEKGFDGNFDDDKDLANCCDRIESSGSLGFSNSTRDHSHEFSESSNMLETPIECNEIEDCMSPDNWNSVDKPGSTARGFSGVICYEEEEESDGEHLECRRKKKPGVTFYEESDESSDQEEHVNCDEGAFRERPVPQKPAKKGLCYHCHKGTRFTEKEACLVCDAKYCGRCILRVMGSMPEGRKCLTCISYPVIESKRPLLGRCSRVLKGLLKEEEVKQAMKNEVSCAANQLPPECIYVNGNPLYMEELLSLRSCSNPPSNLQPGNYWYDKVSGFWGKKGQKPSQIITPHLNVGGTLEKNASNGNTNVFINNREITKAELWMLQSAGIQCDGTLSIWLDADGACQEEGMNQVKRKIWSRKRTKVLCTLLSLPTLESPNPRSRSKNGTEGGLATYLEHIGICKMLLVGNDRSGTSTIYKQARVLYDAPFSEEERQNIKSMIQSSMYGYLGILLEGREQFEQESLSRKNKGKSPDHGVPSYSNSEILTKNDYTIGPKLKDFSDWLINIMVSGNLDIIFPAATREYALFVEELWKDAAIQATYSRREELGLPRAASYFLDKAVEIAKVDYEPSDTDIMYAEGITSNDGLRSMEFSFPETSYDGYYEPAEQTDPVTRCQLIRVHAKSLGMNCKWLEMFEDVRVILFCVSLTEYNEYEFDENGELKNKMLQSKQVFESIVNHPSFEETNFLLVLNKFDLLEEMVEQVPLTHCEWFNDFNPVLSQHQSIRRSGNNIAPLAQRAYHYIAVKFKMLFKSLIGRKLYVCPVTGLETDTVDNALKYAREIVRWEEDKSNYILNESSSESMETSYSSFL